MAETMRIGEFFPSIGAMSPDQVLGVVAAQQRGTPQRFGNIAPDNG